MLQTKDNLGIMILVYRSVLVSLLIPSIAFALINGNRLLDTPDLVRIEFENNESICSGFFINNTTIITAAHCLYSWKDKRVLKIENILGVDDEKLILKVLKTISHPKYYLGGWSQNDLAIIKTTNYKKFSGRFKLKENTTIAKLGEIKLFGAGKIDLTPNVFGRASGVAYYIKVEGFLISLGASINHDLKEGFTSIAPNDSGSPVIDDQGNLIAIASKATVMHSYNTFVPALSFSTIISEGSNYEFILNNSHN